jgi:glycerol-3-phosphate dehydrogenase
LGAVLANGVHVDGLLKDAHGMVCGVRATDTESGRSFEVRARVVVNACGIFADGLRAADDASQRAMIEPAQGVHLVLDRSFLAGHEAIMVPHTDDGRVLFVIPWHDTVVVGTTDTPMREAEHEPRALPEEIEFILRNAARYLERDPTRADVRSVFAGQRPLVHEGGRDGPTKSISRTHKVVVSASGLVTIVGGKWTTYRKMAEDTMARALDVAGLGPRPCVTESLRIHGYVPAGDGAMPSEDWLRVYGSDAPAVRAVCAESASCGTTIAPGLPYMMGAVAYAARHEMARSLDDCLARRTRALLLDARAASGAADAAAAVLARELGRDASWAREEAARFRTLAARYILEP